MFLFYFIFSPLPLLSASVRARVCFSSLLVNAVRDNPDGYPFDWWLCSSLSVLSAPWSVSTARALTSATTKREGRRKKKEQGQNELKGERNRTIVDPRLDGDLLRNRSTAFWNIRILIVSQIASSVNSKCNETIPDVLQREIWRPSTNPYTHREYRMDEDKIEFYCQRRPKSPIAGVQLFNGAAAVARECCRCDRASETFKAIITRKKPTIFRGFENWVYLLAVTLHALSFDEKWSIIYIYTV